MFKTHHRNAFAIVVPLLLALAGCGGGSGGGGPTEIAVPSVAGQSQADAVTAIGSAGLAVGQIISTSSTTVASGSVISQDPAAGTQVSPGSIVNLTVSSGPPPVAVPNVVGSTQAAATASLTNAALALGTVAMVSSSTVASGDVISQSPVAGTSVARGTSVNLTVSSGPPVPVAAPNVVALTKDAAVAAVLSAGLTVGGYSWVTSTTVQYGTISGQYPTAGTEVAAGSSISLTISIGSSSIPATVPNVAGLTESAAALAITTAGATVGNVTLARSTTAAAGTVTSQSPAATIAVPPGSPVDLTVSSGAAGPGFAYVANAGGTVAAFARNSTTGALTPLSPATITVTSSSSGSQALNAITIDPSGKFLYVLGAATVAGNLSGGVYAYTINAATGALTLVSGSPFITGTSPESMVFNASGSAAYVSNLSNSVTGFAIDATTGALKSLSGSPYSLGGSGDAFLLVRVGDFIYTNTEDTLSNPLANFTMLPGNEGLTGLVSSAPVTGSASSALFANPSGSVLFAMAQESTGQNYDLSGYTIDSATGALTALSGNPILTGANLAATLDPSGQYLFLGSFTGGLDVRAINSTTGVVGNAIAGSPFTTTSNDNYPALVVFESTGSYAYVVNTASQTGGSGGGIAEFTFNATAGTLSVVSGSPVATGGNPVGIAVK